MDTKYRMIALKPSISEDEWRGLVEYLNNDETLALASRMFYFMNQHSTHAFDYLFLNIWNKERIILKLQNIC